MPSEIFCSSRLMPSTTASISWSCLSTSRRLGDALGPGKFGDVDQAFDAGFEFHERAVGHEVDDLAFDLRADGILGFDVVPRIGHLLLEAEADAFLLLVDVEHHDVDVLADLEHFGRMADAAPAHVGDVQQAVDAVEVDERAEIGDVLDRALADVARASSRRAASGGVRVRSCFDQFAAGEDDVLPLLVDLDDLEIVGVADELLRDSSGVMTSICDAGRNASTPMLTSRPPLTTALTLPLMRAAFVADGEDAFPVLLELGLFLGEDDHAFLVFEFLDQDIDFVADFDGLDVVEFVAGDDAFAFVADVHQDFLGADFDDGAFDDFACGKAHVALCFRASSMVSITITSELN